MASSQLHGIVNRKDDDANDYVEQAVGFYDDEQPRGRLMSLKLVQMMTSHGREIFFVLVVIFTAYAAFQSSPLKTRKAPFPQRFFAKNSLITDYFTGDVLAAFERLRDSDVTFIMYYAPWDAASIEAQKEFESTAKYYHDQVYFAAVNCWWPEGECRHNFPKIHPFPVLIAYQNTGKGVHFHGTVTFPHLVRFLDRVITPLTVIRNNSHLLDLLVKHDVVVLGFFDFHQTRSPPGYHSFYVAAIKAVERDPDHGTAFAVVSNPNDALEFGLNVSKTIQLYTWNSTKEFIYNGSLTSTKILTWALDNKGGVMKWLAPPHVKSLLLSSTLETSPTLMMLTPRFLTADLVRSPYFYMLKALALDYFDCNRSSRVEGIIRHTMQEILKWKSRRLQHLDLGSRNVEPLPYARTSESEERSCCWSIVFDDRGLVCDVCGGSRTFGTGDWNLLHRHLSWNSHSVPGCSDVFWNVFGKFSMCCCKDKDQTDCRQRANVTDLQEGSRLLRYRRHLEEHSHVMVTMPPLSSLPLRGGDFRKQEPGFTGLGCRTNQTLAFVALDGLQYQDFLERLGTKVLDKPTGTAVVIIHAEELHYTLKAPITVQSLREFITNYTLGTLRRHSRSSVESPSVPTSMSEDEVKVQEITSDNFQKVVMNEEKDVMVMIYAPWCAFCSGIAHIYLSVARYFQSTKDIIFVRINGDANDLPWELTAEKYPTIIFFPAYRKADSIEYPDDVPITTTNLIHFVLTHSKREIRLRTALSLCSASCIAHNRKLALSKIRRLLHQYRTTDGRMRDQLQILREQCVSVSNRMCSAKNYATYLVRELCRVRIQLRHAKMLHLVLGTTESDRLTRRQLQALVDSHVDFKGSIQSDQCQDLTRILDAALDSCPAQKRC